MTQNNKLSTHSGAVLKIYSGPQGMFNMYKCRSLISQFGQMNSCNNKPICFIAVFKLNNLFAKRCTLLFLLSLDVNRAVCLKRHSIGKQKGQEHQGDFSYCKEHIYRCMGTYCEFLGTLQRAPRQQRYCWKVFLILILFVYKTLQPNTHFVLQTDPTCWFSPHIRAQCLSVTENRQQATHPPH